MCPVCRARFRGAAVCSRCGADLTMLMSLAVSAWRLRRAAQHAFAAGDLLNGRSLASEAQQIHYTPAGRKLEALGDFLSLLPADPR